MGKTDFIFTGYMDLRITEFALMVIELIPDQGVMESEGGRFPDQEGTFWSFLLS